MASQRPGFLPQIVSAEVWEGYHRPLQADNWDLALWELTKVSRELNLADCGHVPQEECPAAFVEAVEKMFNSWFP